MSMQFMSPAGRKVQAAIEKTIRDCSAVETRADGTHVRRIDKAASDRIAALALADGRVDWDEDLLIRALVLSPGLVFTDSTALVDALPRPYAEPSVAESAYLRQLREAQAALSQLLKRCDSRLSVGHR
jgi:hypothetical protein